MMVSRVTCVLLFTLFSLLGRAVTQPPELIRICPVGDSLVDVQWIKPTDACNSFVEYRIWGRQNDASLFVLLATINDINIESNLTKLPKDVNITWSFYIEVRFLCDGVSVARSDTLLLDKQPFTLELDSVSVDLATQKTIMGWTASSENDILDYLINVGTSVIDSTAGTFYTDPNSNPTAGPTAHKLTVRDICRQRSAISSPHSTIFLQRQLDSCAKTITLNWQRYIGWGSISQHRVFVSVNGSAFTQTSVLAGGVTQYTFNYNPGDNYRFYVRAVNGTNPNITSSSNIVAQNTRLPIKPSFIYLSQVTVVDNDSIKIKWIHDVAGEISKFNIFKSEDGKKFTFLRSVVNDNNFTQIVFDTQVDVNAKSYYYRVAAYDLCGEYIDSSNTAQSIHLYINKDGLLQWNEYFFWDAGVKDYVIYRGIDVVPQSFTWNILNIKADLPLLYEDTDALLEVGASGICYYVEGRENGTNQYGVEETSTSNRVCQIKPFTIYFPTAFAPNGVNTRFLPVGAYVDYSKSVLSIYNRWGEQLYETNLVSQGWDGRNENGDLYPTGLYIYQAKIFGLDGSFKNFSGTVVLLP